MNRLALCVIALAAGCSSAGPTPRSAEDPGFYEGHASLSPGMEALPSTDVPREAMTEKMRFAMTLAEQTFEYPDPRPPTEETAEAITEWSRTELVTWRQRKLELVTAAAEELDIASRESRRQRIIAGAVVGLMHEDVALTMRSVPVPTEFLDEPQIARIYRDNIDFSASPYFEHARRAYEACSLNARRPETMRHWAPFCRSRLNNLPAPRRVEVGEEGTTVEVIAE